MFSKHRQCLDSKTCVLEDNAHQMDRNAQHSGFHLLRCMSDQSIYWWVWQLLHYLLLLCCWPHQALALENGPCVVLACLACHIFAVVHYGLNLARWQEPVRQNSRLSGWQVDATAVWRLPVELSLQLLWLSLLWSYVLFFGLLAVLGYSCQEQCQFPACIRPLWLNLSCLSCYSLHGP